MATPASVASAGIMGQSMQYHSSFIPWPRQKTLVDQFLHLFNSQTEEQRVIIMMNMFPNVKSAHGVDVGLLRAWLKEVAEIMKWTDEDKVRQLLGIAVRDDAAEAKREEEQARDNAVMDELDVQMGLSPPRQRAPSPFLPPKEPSPSKSDVSNTYYDVEEGWVRKT